MSNTIKYVDHTYRDFSRYIEDGGELIKHKKSGNNFPARLHQILSEPSHSDVITWMPHGRAWMIIDKERLVSEVIPSYYVCKKYESFTRQLNGWGFKRLHQHGADSGCYYHECFLRDLPELTCLIRRFHRGKATPFAEGEPNFYKISGKYPLPPLKSLTQEPQKTSPASSDSSLALDALYLAREEISPSVISNDMSHTILHVLSSSTEPPTTSATASSAPETSVEMSFNSSPQAGGYYHPPSNRSNSQRPPYSVNYTSPHFSGQYYGSSYDHYQIQGQHYPQHQYHPADPRQFHYQENHWLARGYSQESHPNYNRDPSMPPSSDSCVSNRESKCPSEKSSKQENFVDPFEPIPIS